MPKVSVIIPVYNTEKYLKECLDSVINQTLADIEIICVDDGSTDNSLAILKQHAEKDSRIKIFCQKNQGSGPARNLGIKCSIGEFIAFMDADDKYPDLRTLEIMYSKAKENNVLICGGGFSYFTNEDDTLNTNYSDTEDGFGFNDEALINYVNYQFDYGYYRFIFNRVFLFENNLLFPPYRRFQDPPFFVKAMFLAKRFYALNRLTYSFRSEHKSIRWSSVNVNDVLYGIRDNMKFAYKNKLDKLNYYSFVRLKQHYNEFEKSLNVSSSLILKEMEIYNKDVKNFNKENKTLFVQRYVVPMLKKNFSIRNDVRNTHKIITILGLKIKIKRNK